MITLSIDKNSMKTRVCLEDGTDITSALSITRIDIDPVKRGEFVRARLSCIAERIDIEVLPENVIVSTVARKDHNRSINESQYRNDAWAILAHSHGYWPEDIESAARNVWRIWADG